MKANQFLRSNDDAVSPVIAVILMVAITVVLAATVYVWVSGFGSNTNTSPAHTMSMTSAGPIATANGDAVASDANEIYSKRYTISSADPTLMYGDVKLVVAGAEYTFDSTCNVAPALATPVRWGACAGTTPRSATSSVLAGDTITIACWGAVADDPATAAIDESAAATDCLSDKDLLFLDIEANSVMITLKIR